MAFHVQLCDDGLHLFSIDRTHLSSIPPGAVEVPDSVARAALNPVGWSRCLAEPGHAVVFTPRDRSYGDLARYLVAGEREMTTYTVFCGDTFFTLDGADLTAREWQEAAKIAASATPKTPLALAVRDAVWATEEVVRALAREAGVEIIGGRAIPIPDDGRIAAAVEAVRAAVAARAAKLVPVAQTFTCAGGHGCRQPVIRKGTLCAQCAHDQE